MGIVVGFIVTDTAVIPTSSRKGRVLTRGNSVLVWLGNIGICTPEWTVLPFSFPETQTTHTNMFVPVFPLSKTRWDLRGPRLPMKVGGSSLREQPAEPSKKKGGLSQQGAHFVYALCWFPFTGHRGPRRETYMGS